ncbi:hypothetical protein PROFUN_06892 [Planoprotostelium fungivorum]|uniref:Uncharacterized protein n=1 Tax=Planoprotostelium fungivorum TaxID=1890364 RepID=A0A2P6NMT9_9EUKA|nr:hypothetical protein PROFUN_06892 [Planoprotostelium fungivorum]
MGRRIRGMSCKADLNRPYEGKVSGCVTFSGVLIVTQVNSIPMLSSALFTSLKMFCCLSVFAVSLNFPMSRRCQADRLLSTLSAKRNHSFPNMVLTPSKSLLLFVIALAGSTLLLSSQDVDSASSGRELLGLIPSSSSRSTFTNGTVSNRLCALDENGDCHLMGYMEAVLRMSIIAFVMVPLAFLAFWVVCIGRCCCNCFGGWQRTPDNVCYGTRCCGNECLSSEFQGYSMWSVYTVRVLTVVCFIALIAAVIPGIIGNSRVSKGMKGPTNNVMNFTDDLQAKLQTIVGELQTIPYTKDVNNSLDGVYTVFSDSRAQVQKVDVQVNLVDQYRNAVYITLLVLAPIVVLVGILGGLFNIWKLTWSASMFLFLISTLIWSIFAIHYPLLIVTTDSCHEMNILNDNVIRANTSASLGLPFVTNQTSALEELIPILKCSDNRLDSLKKDIEDALDSAYTQACSEDRLQTVCLIANNNITTAAKLKCPLLANKIMQQTVCRNMQKYVDTKDIAYCKVAASLVANMSVLDFDYSSLRCEIVSIEDCEKGNCSDTATKITSDIAINLDILTRYIEILRVEIYPLLGCFLFAPLVSSLTDVVCHQLSPGFEMVETSLLCICIILIPTTILLFLASKRWRRDALQRDYSYVALADGYTINNHEYHSQAYK